MDGYDDMVGLSGYLAEFSMVGNLPTSLGAAAAPPAPPAPTTVTNTLTPVLAKARGLLPPQGKEDLQRDGMAIRVRILQGLLRTAGGAGKTLTGGRWNSATFQAWKNILGFGVEGKRIGPATKWQKALLPGKPQTRVTVPDWAWAPAAAIQKLKARAEQLAAARGTIATMTSTAAPKAPSALDMTANTDDIQGILKRLGASPERLSDGLFGRTTKGFWQEAANKRGKSPAIAAKAGARLKQVMVNKAAYLAIKVDADAKVPPSPGAQEAEPIGGTLKTMDPALVRGVTREELTILVDRLVPGAGKLMPRYESAANKRGVDPRIEADAERFLVIKASLDALTQAFLAAAPKPVGPPSRQANIEAAKAAIAKQATASVSFSVLQTAAAAAAKLGEISTALVTEDAAMSMLIKLAKPADLIWKEAWERFLGPAIAAKQSVKVLPAMAQTVTTLAARFRKAKAAAVDRFKSFTKVNAAEVIARINGLGITTQKFDRAGGPKELADAIKTFLQQSKTPAPIGDLVRTDAQKNTYVKNSIMQSLAAAVTAVQQRAISTKTFRDRMVANALKEASASLSVTSFQQALKHLVIIKQAGKNTPLYSKVKTTGAFDAPTRAAFTEVARSRTIGPAVQEYQRLLGTQGGRTVAQINALVIEARNQVWNAFLDASVKKRDGKLTVALIPAIGMTLASTAALYQKNVSADVRRQEEVSAQMQTLAAAVKKSTATVSILNLQQALSQMIADKEITATQGLKISGSSDAPTRAGLFKLSSLIFPEGLSVPETMWAAYLKQVGYLIVPGQPPKREWIGANYISLPVALADRVATRAGEWIARRGASMVKVVAFKHPSVIGVKMPPPREVVITAKEAAKKVVESPAPVAKDSAAEQAAALKVAVGIATEERMARMKAEQDAETARKVAALAAQKKDAEAAAARQAAAATAAAQRQQQAALLREQQAKSAGDIRAAQAAAAQAQQAAQMAAAQAAEAQAAQARSMSAAREQQAAEARAGGAQVTGPSITGPTIQITTPAPVMKAGMGGGMIAAVLGAGVGIALLLKGGGNPGDESYGS